MADFVVTGGTKGLGKAIALDRLQKGHRVTVIGRTQEAADILVAEARALGAADRVSFYKLNLSSLKDTLACVMTLREKHPRLDGLVLCAKYFSSARHITGEGFEQTWAMYYLSRFVMTYGLLPSLEAADKPVILNVSGPGEPGAIIHWDNLTLETGYDGGVALMQGVRANDLLGLSLVERFPKIRTRYVVIHPGLVETDFVGEYDAAWSAQMDQVRGMCVPLDEGVRPLIETLDNPPAAPFTALKDGSVLPVGGETDRAEASRLDHLTWSTLEPRLGNFADLANVA